MTENTFDVAQSRVAILLASRNGASHIVEQLESIAVQTHRNWRLVVSDDGSTDGTQDLVKEFARRFPDGQVRIVAGPQRGNSESNFMSLLQKEADRLGEFVAFCDQDDVWLPEKLQRGLRALADYSPDIPALYGTRTQIVDENLDPMGLSPLFRRSPEFRNALVQSIAGGNTQILNPAAARLMHDVSHSVPMIVMHDWWAYMLVSAVGGHVIYDPHPTLLYRQHDRNVVGQNSGLVAQAHRLYQMFNGRFRRWNEINITALLSVRRHLSDEACNVLDRFCVLRELSGPRAAMMVRELGLFRQTHVGQLGLYLAAFSRKL